MKLKNYLLKICAIALLLSLTSCGEWVKAMIDKSKALKVITIENGAIPPEFGRNKTTLLCQIEGRKNHDKYVIKNVSENYHGKSVFIQKHMLNSEEYEDVSKYRYYFSIDKEVKKSTSFNVATGRNETHNIVTTSYYILDRKEDIAYECPMKSNAFGKMIKAYMTNLEAVRLKHE